MIKIKNLSVSYQQGNNVIEDINLELFPGNIYGLIGMNGAGKSTLFKSIMGFIRFNQGTIKINNSSIKKAIKENKISYVPQTEEVDWNFPVLVKDVVMMGRYGLMNWMRLPSKEDHYMVRNALAQVELTSLHSRHINQLSGGQKKRVFVARALAQQGKILLLDEPFAGVDVKTELQLIDLFKKLAEQGYLILVSTHNLGSIPNFCNQAILLNKKIIAFGNVFDTFTNEILQKTFTGVLRGQSLHQAYGETNIFTDDERALVIYSEKNNKNKIFTSYK